MFKEYTKAIADEMQTQIGKLVLKEVNAENGTFKVVASDETVDRAGEVIQINAWDLGNYMKNPIILFGHDYRSIENIVGRATSVTPQGKQLVIEGVFASTENAQLCRKLYDEGILKTVSVGFIPLQRDATNNDVITKAELLELSFVPVPCNPNALSLGKEVVDKMVQFGIVKAVDDEGNEIPNGDTPDNPTDTDEKLEQIEKETKALSEAQTLEFQMRALLNAENGIVEGQSNMWIYVCSLYADQFVYNMYGELADETRIDKYYRRSYTLSNGVVQLSGTSVEIKPTRERVDKSNHNPMDEIKEMIKALPKKIKELDTTLPDDNGEATQDSAEKLAEAKQTLQNVSKVVADALHKIKIQ